MGSSFALSGEGLAQAASDLRAGVQELWAVFATETSCCGYLSDRRPAILYERHVFWRLTNGRYSDDNVSQPQPGGYRGGAAEYDRLSRAMALDASAALKSASWGLGQIMGENYSISGFDSIESMVSAMTKSEDAHLLAFTSYLKSRNLDQALRAHDWKTFAFKYNGPGYAAGGYDKKLEANYQKFSAGGLPDFDLRAAQLYLAYLGFAPGPIDGVMGTGTAAALSRFQRSAGLAVTGKLEGETAAKLKETVSVVAGG